MALLGLQTGIVRYVPIAVRQGDEAGLWGIIQIGILVPTLIGLILAGIVFLLAEPIANHIFSEPRMTPVLRLFSLGIPLAALIAATSSVIIGFKRMQYHVYANSVILYLVKFPLTVIMLLIGLGVVGVVAGHVVALAVALALLFYYVNKLFPLNRPLNSARRNPGPLLRFTLPTYLASLVNMLGGSFETLVLGILSMTKEVGVYTAALRLSAVSSMFMLSLGAISEPIISDLYSRAELNQLRRYHQTVTKWEVMFSLPIFLTFVIFAEQLLSIFGADFTAGATALIILASGSLVMASTGPSGYMINMTGHSKLSFINSVFFLIITVVLDILFIPRWGITGAAFAGTLAIVFRNVLQVAEILFLLQILPFNWSFLKPAAAGIVAAGITYLAIHRLVLSSLILQTTAGVALLWGNYFLVLILLKFSEEDRIVLNRLLFRLKFR